MSQHVVGEGAGSICSPTGFFFKNSLSLIDGMTWVGEILTVSALSIKMMWGSKKRFCDCNMTTCSCKNGGKKTIWFGKRGWSLGEPETTMTAYDRLRNVILSNHTPNYISCFCLKICSFASGFVAVLVLNSHFKSKTKLKFNCFNLNKLKFKWLLNWFSLLTHLLFPIIKARLTALQGQ